MRRLGLLPLLGVLVALLAPAGSARADAPANPCVAVSPVAAPCVALQKLADAAAAECRALGLPASDCSLPLSHRVAAGARDLYLRSWVHRAAAFQYRLEDGLPFGRVQWLGTHNSFNSFGDKPTISHGDSNQQLSLSDQLAIDMRALELDIHFIPSTESGGAKVPVVCHGRGPDQANAGCTNERTLSDVLPEITGWLHAHPRQVILLYLEDEIHDPAGYAQTVATLDRVMRRPDGTSLLYRPRTARRAANGCTPMPLGVSRADLRARHAQVMLVGSCAPGWSTDVFDWNPVHVESGSTPAYRDFPVCDATYGRDVYAHKLVRYYEDSTLVATLVAPGTPAEDPGALTPAKVGEMTRCGVNLFGFDQILPDDGRIAASIWSWAPGEPRAARGACAVQGGNGRWVTRGCRQRRRAACLTAAGWVVPPSAVTWSTAPAACRRARARARFAVPRTGLENSRLRRAAGTRPVWLNYRLRR